MNQRDRAFLHDMSTFMCLNRLATVFALWKTATEPELITTSTIKYLHFYNGLVVDAPEQQLHHLVQNNIGNIQSVMIARVFAELFASYEDLGGLGSSIKYRKSHGIFERYVAMTTRQAVSFLQDIIESNIPEHPEITLDVLLQLPPSDQLQKLLPLDVFTQVELSYRELPKYLYEVAKHYTAKRKDIQTVQIEGERPLQQQGNLDIILGFPPPEESASKRSLAADALNRIKHQFLVTGNLAAYTDSEDSRGLEYVALVRGEKSVDDRIQGVILAARVMSHIASILLILDGQGIEI